MTITAKMIEDSISPDEIRLCTMLLRYPRFIHAEFMTHRVFSRNASSSRAIPAKKLIADVRRDPAMPVHWGANQKGMQARAELRGWRLWAVRNLWLLGMWLMTSIAWLAASCGVHKQVVNRLIEPWSHITVVVTSTEWDNFWELRCHKDADPTMRALAEAMRDWFDTSTPKLLRPGEWHLPFVQDHERKHVNNIDLLIMASTARCARTSYYLHDSDRMPSISADNALHDRLVAARPIHASPAEHQATPDVCRNFKDGTHWQFPEEHGNLRGWRQYRKQIERKMQ